MMDAPVDTFAVLHPDLLLPASQLALSPSRKDGISSETEVTYRIWGCQLISLMCIRLKLEQAVIATAQTLLHRFLYRRSLAHFDAHVVAIGAIFLAAKVEETPRRMRDILNVLYATKLSQQHKRNKPLVLGGGVSTFRVCYACLWPTPVLLRPSPHAWFVPWMFMLVVAMHVDGFLSSHQQISLFVMQRVIPATYSPASSLLRVALCSCMPVGRLN